MNSWKPRFSLALTAAILLSSPGLPAYEAAAQAFESPRSVQAPAAWSPALMTVTAGLQENPTADSSFALRTLGQARLELALNPRAASALLFVAKLPAEAATPSLLARFSPEEQAKIVSQAVRSAQADLGGQARRLLDKAKLGPLSAQDRRRLRQISASWFYLPKDQAAAVRDYAPKRALSLAGKIKASLGGQVSAMIGGSAPVDPAVTAESKLLFADTERLAVDGYGGNVQHRLAPYASAAIDAATERLQERGIAAGQLSAYLLTNHRVAFGWDARHALINHMRGIPGQTSDAWTEFVSAVSLAAARKLDAVRGPGAVTALKKAGADYDLRLPIPSWDKASGQAESVAAWLSTKYGAPPADPLGRGLRLGRMFGVPVLLTPGAFLAMAAMGLQFVWIGHGQIGLLAGMLTSAAMYAGVLGHEIGHALMARVFKTPTSKIELNLLGGGAFITHEYRAGLPEFLVALAGPVVTLALAFLPILLGQHHLLFWLPRAFKPALNLFVYFNLLMGAMNLLPLLPMDGGRMLRGVLTGILRDDYKAFRAARLFAKGVSHLGMALGVFLILTGHAPLAWGIMILALIAGLGAGSSSAHPGTKLVADKPAKK